MTDSGELPSLPRSSPLGSARCRSACVAPASPARRDRSGAAADAGGGPARRRAGRVGAGSRGRGLQPDLLDVVSQLVEPMQALVHLECSWGRASRRAPARLQSADRAHDLAAVSRDRGRTGGRPRRHSRTPVMFTCAMSRSYPRWPFDRAPCSSRLGVDEVRRERACVAPEERVRQRAVAPDPRRCRRARSSASAFRR